MTASTISPSRSMISTAVRPQRIALALSSLFFSVQEQRGKIWKATFKAKCSVSVSSGARPDL
jgi:hypothetical protein